MCPTGEFRDVVVHTLGVRQHRFGLLRSRTFLLVVRPVAVVLPDDFRFIDEPVDKDALGNIIYEIQNKYEPEKASNLVSKIQKEAFRLSSINPRTFNADAFTPSDEWQKKKEKFHEKAPNMSEEEFQNEKDKLAQELMQELDDKGVGIQDALGGKTEAKKINKETWANLMISKGPTQTVTGEINRIVEGTADGYSIDNYYKAASEARQGMYLKTDAVRKPGYLARKATMGNANIKIQGDDCRTTSYLEIYVDKKRAETLYGRYMVNQRGNLSLIKDTSKIVDKKIKLRSPMYCKQKKGICSVCYGQLSEDVETKNVGILAGGAINNVATSAMLKQRHSSTKVDTVDVDFEASLKQSTVDIAKLSKYIDVKKKQLVAKDDVTVALDRTKYDEKTLTDLGNKYQLPGIINVLIGEGDNSETFTLPFTFKVDLYIPSNVVKQGPVQYLKFESGETIIEKDKYVKEIDPTIASRMLDGVTKYINDPGVLLDNLAQELPGIDSVHLELITSNMFRSKKDPSTPGRLVNYRNVQLYGCKDLPFVDSWLTGLAFEDVNKAVKSGLISQKDAEMNPIEQVVLDSSQPE